MDWFFLTTKSDNNLVELTDGSKRLEHLILSAYIYKLQICVSQICVAYVECHLPADATELYVTREHIEQCAVRQLCHTVLVQYQAQ